MRVVVDEKACCGYAVCVEFCPQVFSLDEDGISHVEDRDVPPELEERVVLAVNNCPQMALSIKK